MTNRSVGRWNFQDPTQSFHQVLRVRYGLDSKIEPQTSICCWGSASGESEHQRQGNDFIPRVRQSAYRIYIDSLTITDKLLTISTVNSKYAVTKSQDRMLPKLLLFIKATRF